MWSRLDKGEYVRVGINKRRGMGTMGATGRGPPNGRIGATKREEGKGELMMPVYCGSGATAPALTVRKLSSGICVAHRCLSENQASSRWKAKRTSSNASGVGRLFMSTHRHTVKGRLSSRESASALFGVGVLFVAPR